MLEYILTYHRGIFATLFLLPISVIYSAYVNLRNRIMFFWRTAPARHDEKVQRVIRQIELWKEQGCKEKLCTGRSGWKSMSELIPRYKYSYRKIHLDLYDILEIDAIRRVVRVEPLVTMGQLSSTLRAEGWMLPVVPELNDLTVGGLIMGFGIETSSHRYGLFQHICESFEIVTADGDLVPCSRSENPELFHQIPWSHGTLGFLVAAELKIMPAKKYVRLRYQPIFSLSEMTKLFESEARNADNDFVEGIVYSRDTAVIMSGRLTDMAGHDGPVNPINRWYKPWFFKHVENRLRSNSSSVEYIPLEDYFHRHTRSYFWMMKDIIPSGNHPLFRALLGWALPPRIELLKYTETETTRDLRDRHQMIQDMLIPIRYLRKSIEYFDEHTALYPLWLSPMSIWRSGENIGFVRPFRDENGIEDELFVDIGAYGTLKKKDIDARDVLSSLEQFVLQHHGYQALYAKTALSRSDFRRMFDHTGYDRLRDKLPLCKLAFDEVYDKVSTAARAAPLEIRRMKKNQ
ncbi:MULTISPECIES: FAD-binding oxidoreductase [Methylococcus]|uniref:Delta(24)-sterol reductase n=1 Tax=Methylococcus capsulatus TaxID=414 RepID=A0ABZ2F301_METCP|nr:MULTISPECIES: FAD-binding oxidoreductase [Methylococcus]